MPESGGRASGDIDRRRRLITAWVVSRLDKPSCLPSDNALSPGVVETRYVARNQVTRFRRV
jgi:hypothetical protein